MSFWRDRQLEERLLIIYALNIIDVIYTVYFASKFGVEIEGNSFALAFWYQNPALLVLFKLFGVAVLLAVIYIFRKYKAANFASILILVIYGALVIYHVFLLIVSFIPHTA